MNEAALPTVDTLIQAAHNYEHSNESVFINGLASSNPSIVWWAIRGCGLKRIEESIPMLLEVLGKPCVSLGETDVRRIAALALSQMGFDSIVDHVHDVIDDPNPLLREGVADALGLTQDRRAVPILDQFLNDQDQSVLLWTCLALSKLGNVALKPLEQHLVRTNDQTKVVYMLDALNKIGTEEAKKAMLRYFEITPFKNLKNNADRFLPT